MANIKFDMPDNYIVWSRELLTRRDVLTNIPRNVKLEYVTKDRRGRLEPNEYVFKNTNEFAYKRDIVSMTFVKQDEYHQKWGTPNKIYLTSVDGEQFIVRANGFIEWQIDQYNMFVKKFVKDTDVTSESMTKILRPIIVECFTATIGTIDSFNPFELPKIIEKINVIFKDKINNKFKAYGLKANQIIINNLDVPDLQDIKVEKTNQKAREE